MQVGLPQAQLVLFEHSGHFPWIEELERFSQTVKAWLEQVRASPRLRALGRYTDKLPSG